MYHCYITTALEGLEVSSLKDVVCFSAFAPECKVYSELDHAHACVASLPSYRFLKTQNTCRYNNVPPSNKPAAINYNKTPKRQHAIEKESLSQKYIQLTQNARMPFLPGDIKK